MSQPIIFLDIDGPMIPSSMYFVDEHASWDRVFSPVCLAILKTMLEDFDAILVTNSTHNLTIESVAGGRSLQEDLIAAGVPEARIHKDWRTVYPQLDRWQSVNLWMSEHPEFDRWIALDDCLFTTDEKLIPVDFDTGLTTYHYNQAAGILGHTPKLILG